MVYCFQCRDIFGFFYFYSLVWPKSLLLLFQLVYSALWCSSAHSVLRTHAWIAACPNWASPLNLGLALINTFLIFYLFAYLLLTSQKLTRWNHWSKTLLRDPCLHCPWCKRRSWTRSSCLKSSPCWRNVTIPCTSHSHYTLHRCFLSGGVLSPPRTPYLSNHIGESIDSVSLSLT